MTSREAFLWLARAAVGVLKLRRRVSIAQEQAAKQVRAVQELSASQTVAVLWPLEALLPLFR